jgi:uncharacterized protein YjbI with pentapeptide repeats
MDNLKSTYEIAIEFLESAPHKKLSILDRLGLKRYAQLLLQMPLTTENIQCVAQILTQPDRVKFPQLMGTNLVGLNLGGVNFIRANLTGANLQGCCLRDADLIFGNFTNADLTNADLQGATLNETLWNNAIVVNCNFSHAIGLTACQIQDLRSRGGIF